MSAVEDSKNGEGLSSSASSPTKNSPKSSPTKKDIDIATQALNHFAQGKRHLLVSDVNSAVNSLQEACRLLAEHYGETAFECADAYYYYGRALLEMARIENGVLGNALDGEEEGSTESEGECDKKDGDDDSEEKEDADEENGEGDNETEAEESQEEPEGDQTEEEEEVGNLQLSWEMFELSKVIFLKQEVVNQQKVSQVYLKLGEVGLESENYSQSIEDFTSCLEIQKKTLQPDDRCLAETYYQLGVAHSFSDDFDKAMDNFSAAANVIETRISNLKNKIKEKESWTEEQKHKSVTEQEDPFYTEQGEIDELDKLLPEIKEKLIDMEEMKKDTKEKLEKVKEATFASVLGGSRSTGTSSEEASTSEGFSCGFSEATKESSVNKIEAKPTSNISHLIRKKRKPEEEAEKEDLKKAKGDAEGKDHICAVNGTSKLDKMETDSVPVEKEEDKAKVVAPLDDKMECSTTA